MKESKINETIISCECGTHLLLVQSCIDYHICDKTKEEHYNQDFNFAMFSYGEYRSKPNLWERLKYAWYHIKTGKIYSDQLTLNPAEAKKLTYFITNNMENGNN